LGCGHCDDAKGKNQFWKNLKEIRRQYRGQKGYHDDEYEEDYHHLKMHSNIAHEILEELKDHHLPEKTARFILGRKFADGRLFDSEQNKRNRLKNKSVYGGSATRIGGAPNGRHLSNRPLETHANAQERELPINQRTIKGRLKSLFRSPKPPRKTRSAILDRDIINRNDNNTNSGSKIPASIASIALERKTIDSQKDRKMEMKIGVVASGDGRGEDDAKRRPRRISDISHLNFHLLRPRKSYHREHPTLTYRNALKNSNNSRKTFAHRKEFKSPSLGTGIPQFAPMTSSMKEVNLCEPMAHGKDQ